MPLKDEQRIADVEEFFKTAKILNRNSILLKKMETAYHLYTQEVSRLSEVFGPCQIPEYIVQALLDPSTHFYLTTEKTLCWTHYGTPVTLSSFQFFFPQHKLTSDECFYLRKLLGYLKDCFLAQIPNLSALSSHKYRENHQRQVQVFKAKTLPLPVTSYQKNTTPPIHFLYAITGGDMNLLCQYAKLFSAVAFPLQSPKKLFLLSGKQEDLNTFCDWFNYLFLFPYRVYEIPAYCTPNNFELHIRDSFFGIRYTYLYFQQEPSRGKLSQLEWDQISFLKKAVNSVVLHKHDEISGQLYWRNHAPIILYSNHDQFNTALCNQINVEHIHIPHITQLENNTNREWLLSYLVTYGLWLSCGAKLPKLSTSRSVKLKRDKSVFDLFLACACQYQQGSRVHCQELYQGYADLCKNLNQIPMSSREFFNYFKNNGNYLWKRTRTKADDYKTYIVNLSYLGTDTLDLHQDIHDKESFADALSQITAEVDNVIPTGATTTDCNNCHG